MPSPVEITFSHYPRSSVPPSTAVQHARSDFEFYIPVVAERFFQEGSPSDGELRIDEYAADLARVLADAGVKDRVTIDPAADAGPGAPWPIIIAIITGIDVGLSIAKISSEVREWAAARDKEPIFSEGYLLRLAGEKLGECHPRSQLSHFTTLVRRRYGSDLLQHGVTYCFVFRNLEQYDGWYLAIIDSGGRVLSLQQSQCPQGEVGTMADAQIEALVGHRHEYLETQIHDRPVPATQVFATEPEAESYLSLLTDMFPEWDFEITKRNTLWRVQVSLGEYVEQTLEDAQRRRGVLQALFNEREFGIVSRPPVYVVRERSGER